MSSKKTSKDNPSRSNRASSESSKKTALDVAHSIKEMIRSEYPGMPETHAMRLAVLLTKVELKKGI